MTAVGGLVLVLGFLVSARCEVRARDPEVEEDEERGGGRGGRGGGVEGFPPHPWATQTPPLGERGNYPARTGNWCAFVQRRVVTKTAVCGSEKYVMKSQSPCPSGAPDCQLPMYKLSSRPLYRQKQQIYSALLWHCCPGYGGHNCEDTVSDTQLDSASSDLVGGSGPVRPELHVPGVQLERLQQRDDPNREQNDHEAPYHTGDPDSPHTTPPPAHHSPPPDLHRDDGRHHTAHAHHSPPPDLQPDHGRHHTPAPAVRREHCRHHTAHAAGSTQDHQHHLDHGQQELRLPDTATLPDAPATATIPYPDFPSGDSYPYADAPPYPDPDDFPYPDAPAALPVPHILALVMSQLQPVLQGFNHSLEHLSRQVGELARDVAELKSSRLDAEPQPPQSSHHAVQPDLAEAADERLDARLEEAFEHVREVQRQLESQRRDMEIRLHSQHAMLQYNLTMLKMDIDMKLKRHQKMLQVSLQAMNATLMELNQNQDQYQDQDQDQTTEELAPHLLQPQPSDTAALWEAVERLDNMVVNNTVKVEGLVEDAEVTAGSVQQLRRDIKLLEKLINATARTGQVQFMETGLEVELARETVLRRVGELAANLSAYGERLTETDSDVDHLYEALYKRNTSAGCDCAALWAAVATLERGVANVTQLANENRAALDEDGGAGLWAGGGDWEPAVEALQHALQQVRESVASVTSEQSSSRSLDQRLTQLSRSLAAALADVSALTESERKQREEMQRLSASFLSLLADAVRHSDVLEILLGEEVLEFLDWPVQDQEAHSVPALKETLRGHEQSIAALLARNTGDREELPSADQPPPSSSLLSDGWRPASVTKNAGGGAARERQRLLQADGGDLWNLEITVEELKMKVLQLEETMAPSGGAAALQAEVTWLKRGLEEHLRTFKNVFSNADVLAGSAATLELDKLWQLLQSRDEKKEKKKKKGGNHRSRRETTGETTGVAPVPSSQSGASVLLAAGGDARRRRPGWN